MKKIENGNNVINAQKKLRSDKKINPKKFLNFGLLDKTEQRL